MVAVIHKVTMPKWGLSMTTGKITEWIVGEGDPVSEGDELADVDTDKIAGALEAAEEGVLRRIVAKVGEDVPVGATIALIADPSVPDDELDALAEQARAALDSGEVAEVEGPVTGSVEVDGRTICYATLGDAPSHVVLLHGYGGDKNSWLFVQEPLSAAHTVHALDLPGHGESTKDVGDGSLDLLARAVLGFLAARDIERAHLVGHSLGGAVAVAAAAEEPARVASLTLVAPAGFGPDINAAYLRGFASASSRRELKPHLGELFADPGQVTRQFADDLLRYKRLDGVQQVLDTLTGTLLDGDVPALDLTPLLHQLSTPVAVVWGRADAVLPSSNGAVLRDVRYVEDAGHMVHLEKPAAVVAAVESVAGLTLSRHGDEGHTGGEE